MYAVFLCYRDGIPPYKLGTKKQLQREMHRSVKINGQVTLPHFPVSPTSLSFASCLSVSFFVIWWTQTFTQLTDNWVLIPSRSCTLFMYLFSELALWQNTIFRSLASFTLKAGKWKAGFAYYFASSSAGSNPPSSYILSHFSGAVNVNAVTSLSL